MRKTLRSFAVLFILLTIVAAVIPQAGAVGSSGKCGDNLTYTYSNGVLTISGTGDMSESIYPNYSPFDNDKYIKSVIVEEGVTSICTRAFYGCENLSSISLPSTIECIDGQAFKNTAYYNDPANWENGVLYIGNHLIEAKKELSGEYRIKDGTITIGYMAFENCTKLTSVILPDSIRNIGTYAFRKCTSLSNLTMSQSIKRIDASAFGSCNDLKEVSLPDQVMNIESTAFAGTGYAQNQNNWENGALYIGKHLVDFNGSNYCDVKSGTLDIARAAFEDCSELRVISIPASVKHIGAYLTYNCYNLKKIYFAGTKNEWDGIVAEPNKDLLTHTIIFGQVHEHQTYVVKENETQATCTANGGYANVYYCRECECEVRRESVVFPMLGHALGDWKMIKAPTCIEDGQETSACTRTNCSHTESRTLSALGHAFSDPVVLKKPTCIENGAEVAVCTRCNDDQTSIINAVGHKYETKWCHDATNHWIECAECKDKKDASTHIPGKEATETTPQTCTICEYIIAPALGSTGTSPTTPDQPTTPATPTNPSVSTEPSDPVETTEQNTTAPTDPSESLNVTESTQATSSTIPTNSDQNKSEQGAPVGGILVAIIAVLGVGIAFFVAKKRKTG